MNSFCVFSYSNELVNADDFAEILFTIFKCSSKITL